MAKPQHDLVVVANRLPVDMRLDESGNPTWKRAPGGLVTALAPLMQANEGAWVGWPGMADLAVDPFDSDGIWMVPVSLSENELTEYYEGFSNDTLWPLYHDVIARPSFHREWWDTYREVNEHFASMADYAAAEGATVWVHDYQLQLVPALLRAARPDLRIGYFHHIPFPPLEIFSQLPWRRQIVEGLLGADLVGFQRSGDAANFLRCVRKLTDHTTSGQHVDIDDQEDRLVRRVKASAFPISIDSGQFDKLARSAAVRKRATEIREDLGNPECMLLGVDRLDYTKGILHRIKAFSEILRDGEVDPSKVALIQVASPSRENVDAYQQLRDEVEGQVGRINGEFGSIGQPVINYLHHSYPLEEMAALYLASDVMLVTSLRDGMNLVAKEYVAARSDDRGVLVLSEFTGAAEELTAALLINPHDIDGTKAQIVAAMNMPVAEQRRRMKRLRRRVLADDVAKWSNNYLATLTDVATSQPERVDTPPSGTLGPRLREALEVFARKPSPVLVASDFDGVLAPLVDDPSTSRTVPRALRALRRISTLPQDDVAVALVSGRSLEMLAQLSNVPAGTHLLGSHGAERGLMTADGLVREDLALTEGEQSQLRHVTEGMDEIAARHSGVWVENKPSAAVLHTRLTTHDGAEQASNAALELASRLGLQPLIGKNVVEIAVLQTTKGRALDALRSELGASQVIYMGDDATDEHAFAVLSHDDVAIKVGPGESIAPYRIADSSAAALVLERLGALLSAHLQPTRRRRRRA